MDVERLNAHDALPLMPETPRVQARVPLRREKYITWAYADEYANGYGWTAVSVDDQTHSKGCQDWFEDILQSPEDEKAMKEVTMYVACEVVHEQEYGEHIQLEIEILSVAYESDTRPGSIGGGTTLVHFETPP